MGNSLTFCEQTTYLDLQTTKNATQLLHISNEAGIPLRYSGFITFYLRSFVTSHVLNRELL